MVISKSKRGGARPNTGGARPGSGRKSKAEEFGLAAFMDGCLTLEQRKKVIANLYEFAIGSNAKAAVGAASLLMAYAYGKPTERHEHTGAEGEPFEVIVRHVTGATEAAD